MKRTPVEGATTEKPQFHSGGYICFSVIGSKRQFSYSRYSRGFARYFHVTTNTGGFTVGQNGRKMTLTQSGTQLVVETASDRVKCKEMQQICKDLADLVCHSPIDVGAMWWVAKRNPGIISKRHCTLRRA